MEITFYAIRRLIGPIIWQRISRLFRPSLGSRCRSPFRTLKSSSFSERFADCSALFQYFLSPCRMSGFMFRRRRSRKRKNAFELALEQLQTLLWCGLTVVLLVQSESWWHPSRRQLSHGEYFMQDMTHPVFWDATVSSISRTFNRRGANKRWWTFDTLIMATRFPFEKQEWSPTDIVPFPDFSKSRRHARFHTRLKQGHESDSFDSNRLSGVYYMIVHFLAIEYATERQKSFLSNYLPIQPFQ